MLDVLIHIFHDIFGEGRSEKAAMAKGAMAELRAALAPGDDFSAMEMFADFFVHVIVAGHVVIDDLAIVQDSFDFLRAGFGTEGKRSERGAARVSGEFFASKKTCTESRAGVACNGLDVDIFEAAAEFEGTDEKDVGEDSAGKA